jgi:hypothetical protein
MREEDFFPNLSIEVRIYYSFITERQGFINKLAGRSPQRNGPAGSKLF